MLSHCDSACTLSPVGGEKAVESDSCVVWCSVYLDLCELRLKFLLFIGVLAFRGCWRLLLPPFFSQTQGPISGRCRNISDFTHLDPMRGFTV